MAVASVYAAPAVDDDVGAEFADDADHVFEDGFAPDFFGFFGSFGEAEILGAGEIEFDAVASGGGEKFLGADEAELRGLFGAESVLAAFATRDGEKCDVGVEAACEIGEDGAAFIVGMRGDVEDAGGDAGGVDGFDGFGEAGAGAGGGRGAGGRAWWVAGRPGRGPGAGGNWAREGRARSAVKSKSVARRMRFKR